MSPRPLLAPPLAGNVLGSPGDAFVIAEWRDPGGPAGPPRFIAPLHLHRHDDEAWYVLEGTLFIRVGDQDVEARAGSAVLVPRGTPHRSALRTPCGRCFANTIPSFFSADDRLRATRNIRF